MLVWHLRHFDSYYWAAKGRRWWSKHGIHVSAGTVIQNKILDVLEAKFVSLLVDETIICPNRHSWKCAWDMFLITSCLYQAMSLALYGTEKHQGYLCVRTAMEISSNPTAYNSDSPMFLLKDLPVLTPNYNQLLCDTICNGSYAEPIHLFALSKALGRHKLTDH